ncbi:hypothetical protein GUJ93_ZPchr0010g8289 [Zizania palustris]|uniref:Uncharacterized protein n=1 Tax=Zizania palustris TaxID=103762 RepID=A0A8J6BHP6_ZIZPA|nr:hypothetical protein GUJ93_ZPchr0010g8289 [Zizania palustris]
MKQEETFTPVFNGPTWKHIIGGSINASSVTITGFQFQLTPSLCHPYMSSSVQQLNNMVLGPARTGHMNLQAWMCISILVGTNLIFSTS